MKKRFDVFISHSSKDKKVAESIGNYLKEKGLKPFLSYETIELGANYMEELVTGIQQSEIMLLILTKDANESEHVLREVNRAAEYKVPIVLFRIQNINLSKGLEYYLSTFQWLEATESKPAAYFEQVYAMLNGLPRPPMPKKYISKRKLIQRVLTVYAITSLAAFFIFGIPVLKDYFFIAKKNDRGVNLVDAVRDFGLTDIELRSNTINTLPPDSIYKRAQKEIFISGTTLLRTINMHNQVLLNALQNGVKVKLLLLNPNSEDSAIIIRLKGEGIRMPILTTIEAIRKQGFLQYDNFEVRFLDHISTLYGVVTDGDIADTSANADDKNGMLRMNLFLCGNNFDAIYQFNNEDGKPAFENYIKEFRYIWLQEGKIHNEYFR